MARLNVIIGRVILLPCPPMGCGAVERYPAMAQPTKEQLLGGSPGLVVMGRDSCSKGREFESWHCILEENFSHSFVIKIVMCV